MVIRDRKCCYTNFAQLILEVKKTSFTQATGFWENQRQKIFKNLRIRFQIGQLELNDCKYLLYLQLNKNSSKFNEFNRRIQYL